MSDDDDKGPKGLIPGGKRTTLRSNSSKMRVAEQTALVDPQARAKALVAAQTAGFDNLEQFVDFMVDSGLLCLPPKDGITATFTLEDLGLHLWNSMQQQPVGKRAVWFHGLATTQQTAILVVLRSRGFSTHNIARELAIEERFVRQAWTKYADDLGAQVVGIRLNTIAGELQARMELVTEQLMTSGRPELAFRVHKDYLKILQDLGVVDRAKREVVVTHKIDDEQKRELDRLVQLREKVQKRQEEIKQAEVEVFDEVPTQN